MCWENPRPSTHLHFQPCGAGHVYIYNDVHLKHVICSALVYNTTLLLLLWCRQSVQTETSGRNKQQQQQQQHTGAIQLITDSSQSVCRLRSVHKEHNVTKWRGAAETARPCKRWSRTPGVIQATVLELTSCGLPGEKDKLASWSTETKSNYRWMDSALTFPFASDCVSVCKRTHLQSTGRGEGYLLPNKKNPAMKHTVSFPACLHQYIWAILSLTLCFFLPLFSILFHEHGFLLALLALRRWRGAFSLPLPLSVMCRIPQPSYSAPRWAALLITLIKSFFCAALRTAAEWQRGGNGPLSALLWRWRLRQRLSPPHCEPQPN